MTNKEKNISNASNEQLAKLLANKCFITATNKLTFGTFGRGKESDLHSIEKWLSQEAELTADEMFAELEYVIQSQDNYTIKYRKITRNPYLEIRLVRNTHTHEWEYEKYYVEEDNESELITQKEDKAIHKKIEELKKI